MRRTTIAEDNARQTYGKFIAVSAELCYAILRLEELRDDATGVDRLHLQKILGGLQEAQSLLSCRTAAAAETYASYRTES